jgi:hypothetical protein
VNPVDYKVRTSAAPPAGTAKVIGCGIVVEAGSQASLFRSGDEVFYTGSNIRSGTNAEFHLVDERIVAHARICRARGVAAHIDHCVELFDRMDIRKPVRGSIAASDPGIGILRMSNLPIVETLAAMN